ncbi:C-type mannose receptor 2-like isoform X2 [Ptychodera flava]|uniref:C-type mannose receptor 2-like isoform X2 n=1 Tax=Ptychodera flava TaxID=63121 RepID=UPI00396A8CC0
MDGRIHDFMSSGLQLFREPKSFPDAQASCMANGMILAKDTSESTHSAILSMIRSNGLENTDVWINGIQLKNNQWVTTDGDPLTTYQRWTRREPNGSGHCLQLWQARDHDWDDTPCRYTKPYLCDQGGADVQSSLQMFTEPMTKGDAQATCEANGMTLVVDRSESTHSEILSLIYAYGLRDSDIWVNGLQMHDGEWVTIEGEPLTSYHPWTWAEPNGSGRCLQLWAGRDQDWDDTPCKKTKPFICDQDEYKEPAFKLFTSSKSHEDAQATCEASGMTLAIDTSEETHSAIIRLLILNQLHNTDVWINGHQDSSNDWVTSDGAALTAYHPWANGEPNGSGRCLQLWAGRQHQWDDTPCSIRKVFVCGYTAPPPTEAPPTPPPPTLPAQTTAAPATMIPTLAPCEFPSGLHNVAEGRPTSQSSDKPKKDSGSENAVDGDFSTDVATGSCSWTNKEYQPWWKVDLGRSHDIYEVVITNREDCCPFRIKNAEIRVGDSDNFEDNPICGMMILGRMAKVNPIHVRCGCETPMSGRYVSVQLIDRTQMLTMCEVEVMAA